MFTWGSRNLLGVAALAWIGALIYGLTTGGHVIGVLSMGYKHGVGDHVGYTILMGAALVALLLAIVSVTTRDGNSEDMSALVGVEHSLAVRPPAQAVFWGPLTAFGLACIAVGVATSRAFLYLGFAVIAVSVFEWAVLAWSDRATGDTEVNSVIRSRLLSPFEVPILALLGAAVVVLGLSRVLLAVSEVGSVVVAVVAAAGIFAAAIFIAKTRAPRPIISAIIAFGAVAVLAGGIVGAAVGERDFHHGEQPSDSGDHAEEGEG
ncbi:MAG: hypothetical protein OER95_14970 [Acidimicrobiia bacterium]|nr:hypothetical protein [Acidimicrobiia bacterium]